MLVRVGLLSILLIAAGMPASSSSTPLQPGTQVNGTCTLNFVYEGTGALAGELFMGTAAHCVVGVGQVATTSEHGRIGEVAYRGGLETRGDTYDFAFIKIDAGLHGLVDPQVKGHPGMPSGVASAAQTSVGDRVMFSGYGLGYSSSEPTREDRVGVLAADNDSTWWSYMWATPGDSGGPLLHQSGMALGIVTHLTAASFSCCGDDLHATTGSDGPTVAGIVTRAAGDGFTVRLATA